MHQKGISRSLWIRWCFLLSLGRDYFLLWKEEKIGELREAWASSVCLSPESHNQSPGWHATPSLLATASQGAFLPMLTVVSTPQPTPLPSLGWSGDLPDNDYSIRMSRCGALPTVSGDQVLLVGFNFRQVILMAFGLTSLAKGSHAHIFMYKGCLVPPLPQMENLSNDCSL